MFKSKKDPAVQIGNEIEQTVKMKGMQNETDRRVFMIWSSEYMNRSLLGMTLGISLGFLLSKPNAPKGTSAEWRTPINQYIWLYRTLNFKLPPPQRNQLLRYTLGFIGIVVGHRVFVGSQDKRAKDLFERFVMIDSPMGAFARARLIELDPENPLVRRFSEQQQLQQLQHQMGGEPAIATTDSWGVEHHDGADHGQQQQQQQQLYPYQVEQPAPASTPGMPQRSYYSRLPGMRQPQQQQQQQQQHKTHDDDYSDDYHDDDDNNNDDDGSDDVNLDDLYEAPDVDDDDDHSSSGYDEPYDYDDGDDDGDGTSPVDLVDNSLESNHHRLINPTNSNNYNTMTANGYAQRLEQITGRPMIQQQQQQQR